MKKQYLIFLLLGIVFFIIVYGPKKAYAQIMRKALYVTPDNRSEFESMIQNASDEYGVDIDLIRAIIMQESAYDNNAGTGVMGFDGLSIGLMQITKPVASDFLNIPIDKIQFSDFSDAELNINIGTHLLSTLVKYGDEAQIMSYNEGHGNYLKGKRVIDYYNSVVNYYNQYIAGDNQ